MLRKISVALIALLLCAGLAAAQSPAVRNIILFAKTAPWAFPGTSVDDNFAAGLCSENQMLVPCTSHVSVTRSSSKTCAYANGTLISVTSNVLCVTDQGALIEEARTNLVTQSQTFAGWALVSTVITPNSATAPDGTTTATLFNEGTATGFHTAILTGGASGTNTYTISAYVKPLGTNTGIFISNKSGGGFAVFSLIGAGSVTNSGGGTNETYVTASVTASTSGWYRVSLTTAFTVSTTLAPTLALGTGSYTGTSQTFLYWGAQQELGAFPTSYIPTTTTSATRAADVPRLIGPALTAALNAKSAFAQTYLVNAAATTPVVWQTSSGAAAAYFGSSTTLTFRNDALNAATATFGSGTVAGTAKIALGLDATSITSIVNGGTKAVSNNAFSTVGQMRYLGIAPAGTFALNGYMQRFALSPVKGVFDASTQLPYLLKRDVIPGTPANDNTPMFLNEAA